MLPLLLMVAACASSRGPAERVGQAVAGEGELWVEVYNGTTDPLTVFAGRRSLGHVNPGQREDFRIPPRSERVYVTGVDGKEVPTGSTGELAFNHQRSAAVQLRYYRVASAAP